MNSDENKICFQKQLSSIHVCFVYLKSGNILSDTVLPRKEETLQNSSIFLVHYSSVHFTDSSIFLVHYSSVQFFLSSIFLVNYSSVHFRNSSIFLVNHSSVHFFLSSVFLVHYSSVHFPKFIHFLSSLQLCSLSEIHPFS